MDTGVCIEKVEYTVLHHKSFGRIGMNMNEGYTRLRGGGVHCRVVGTHVFVDEGVGMYVYVEGRMG